MTFFEFLETYYIWLLVVVVILIITIIGYLADRRDKKRKLAKEQNTMTTNVSAESISNIASDVPNQGNVGMANQVNAMPNQSEAVNQNVAQVNSNVNIPNTAMGVNLDENVAPSNPQTKIMNNIQGVIPNVVPDVQPNNVNNFANYSEPTTMVPPVSDMPKVDGPIMTHEVDEVPIQTAPLDSMIKVVEETDTVVAPSAVSENVNVVSNEVPPVAPNFSSTPIMETPAMNMVDVQPINNPSQTPIVEPPVVEPISPVADVVTPVDGQPTNLVLENKSDEQIVIPVEEPLVQQPVTSMPTAQNATDMVGNLNGVSGSDIVIPKEQQVVDSQVESNTIVYPQEQNINTADNFEDDIWKL